LRDGIGRGLLAELFGESTAFCFAHELQLLIAPHVDAKDPRHRRIGERRILGVAKRAREQTFRSQRRRELSGWRVEREGRQRFVTRATRSEDDSAHEHREGHTFKRSAAP